MLLDTASIVDEQVQETPPVRDNDALRTPDGEVLGEGDSLLELLSYEIELVSIFGKLYLGLNL